MCTCGTDHTLDETPYVHYSLSRRDLLKQSAVAMVGGAAAMLAPASAAAQAPAAAQAAQAAGGAGRPPLALFWGNGVGGNTAAAAAAVEAERQATSKTAGTKFKALVRHGTSLTTETLTLKPIHPLQVVVRMQAVQTCYSTVGQLPLNPAPVQNAVVTGHGGVGIVEDIGNAVRKVKVGDQVILATTPNCGTCGNCLNGRGDLCYMRLPALQSATMADNTPVFMTAPPVGPCGYSEFVVADEDWCVPVFTSVSAQELSILACVGGTGLGLAMCRFPVTAGADVAMFGLGPIGISAVQGARIQGAKVIIGIDPIRYRRDLALKLGATHVLDPNELKGNDLIAKIRELTPDTVPNGRRYAGERAAGPEFVFESVGGTRMPTAPGVEMPTDPTGVEPLQQAWTVARSAGYVRTSSIGQPMGATVSFPAGQWANAGKTHVPGNYAGVQALRDLPRFVRLIERGQFDAKSLIGRVYKTGQMREALEACGRREVITTLIDFT